MDLPVPKSINDSFLESVISDKVTAESVSNAVPKFTQIDCFDTFKAEYVIQNGNYIIHFFLREEGNKITEGGWATLFPSILSPVAEEYFQATKPRIVAIYVPELKSWYMKANGFAHRLDADEFIDRFFEKLDAALDQSASQ